MGETLESDLKPFLHEKDNQTFRRLPTSESADNDIGVTVTASAFMGLALGKRLGSFYPNPNDVCKRVAQRIAEVKWMSSGLPEANAFTTTLILRALHLIGDRDLLDFVKKRPELDTKKNERPGELSDECNGKTYLDIAKLFAAKAMDNKNASLRVENYPTSPAIAYWFTDAITDMPIGTDDDWWLGMADWASREFTRHVSLVAAKFSERIDPVAMAMAACLAQRIRNVGDQGKVSRRGDLAERLPSLQELRHGIRALFAEQLDSGIWNKYFPLFHYPGAGSNYCFAFEMLEAILNEFGGDLVIEEKPVFAGFEKAIGWCRGNRLKYHHNGVDYNGWNSGGDMDALAKGMPESWATAVVHMFLHTLDRVLTVLVERKVRGLYREVTASRSWDVLIDSDVVLPGAGRSTAKKLIEDHLLTGLAASHGGLKSATLRDAPLPRHQRRSALLFGPPGTSKTTLVRAFAQRLGWKCVEITPSQFLEGGLAGIYQRSNEVFADLADLSGVVILFDEMDALGRRRDAAPGQGGSLDITSQFLTTSMLPKLAKLHDDARVVYFLLTNHRQAFDPAITRPGRFDLLICVGPPSWERKLAALPGLLSGLGPADDLAQMTKLVQEWTKDNIAVNNQLDRFTVDEVRALFDYIRGGDTILKAVQNLGQNPFINMVGDWAANSIVLHGEAGSNDLLKEYEDDKKQTKLQ